MSTCRLFPGVLAAACLAVIPSIAYCQPASSAWPMFRHDAQHTGRAAFAGVTNPAIAWSYQTGHLISSPAVGTDGSVRIGGYDNTLYALSPTGVLAWSYATDGSIASSPAIDTLGRSFFGGENSRFYTLYLGGTLAWSYDTGSMESQIESSPVIGPNGKVYVGSGNDCRVYAFASSGSLAWSYRTGQRVHSSPALWLDGRVYVGSGDNRMYAFSSKGALVWSYNVGAGIYNSSPAISPDGRVQIGTGVPIYDPIGRVFSFTYAGALSWSYMTGGYLLSSPALGSDGRVFVGSSDNNLYAFTSAGGLAWSYATEDIIISSPAVSSEGLVYVGTGSYDPTPLPRSVYAFTSGGALAWSYKTGDTVASSPVIAGNGLLYVGSFDNVLYCLENATPEPTPTPPIDLTAQKTVFQTTDRIEVFADVWPFSTPCYPFVRIVMPDGSTLWYESGKGFMGSPVPYLGFAAGPITVASPIPGYPALSANFSGIAAGIYVLEGGAVDATKTTSADTIVYFGTVDRETLTVQ